MNGENHAPRVTGPCAELLTDRALAVARLSPLLFLPSREHSLSVLFLLSFLQNQHLCAPNALSVDLQSAIWSEFLSTVLSRESGMQLRAAISSVRPTVLAKSEKRWNGSSYTYLVVNGG
jgi:hypothetical protein